MGHFRVAVCLSFEASLGAQLIYATHFHLNGCAPGLALKLRRLCKPETQSCLFTHANTPLTNKSTRTILVVWEFLVN